jgi:hypothetical protein
MYFKMIYIYTNVSLYLHFSKIVVSRYPRIAYRIHIQVSVLPSMAILGGLELCLRGASCPVVSIVGRSFIRGRIAICLSGQPVAEN